MKISLFIALLLSISIFSCISDDLSQEREAQNLREMISEIENMTNNIVCENSADWAITGYGSKACGGAKGYIAYSLNIDVDLFLNLIEEHKEKEREFNMKWGIISDCSLTPAPSGVICEDGNPVLQY